MTYIIMIMKNKLLLAQCFVGICLNFPGSSIDAKEKAFPSKVKTPQVTLELVSDQASIVPGKPFTLGLRIHHAPKYHTYWEYPGVVGIPTECQWSLPDGFSAGKIQWPVPELTKMGLLSVYGYEGDTTLLIDITPPADLTAGDDVVLNTRVVYMACAETCHPGFVDLGITLPVTVKKARVHASMQKEFEAVRQDFATSSTAWKFSGEGDMENLTLKMVPGKGANTGIEAWYFFDRDGQVDSDVKFTFDRSEGAYVTKMKRVDWAEKLPTRIRGILHSAESLEIGRDVHAISVDISL